MWNINLNTIYDTTNAIKNYKHNSKADLYSLCNNIANVLKDWTGNTYVGNEKEPNIKKAFQNFFLAFTKFISDCANSIDKLKQSLANNTMYYGTVYRYIGAKTENDDAPDIRYDNIYVSWSKAPYNEYIQMHIYTKMTWIKCEIRNPIFGIDIEGFEKWCKTHFDKNIKIAKGTEQEVIFPTIKEYITETIKPFKCNKWAENGYSCECCRDNLDHNDFLDCSGLNK